MRSGREQLRAIEERGGDVNGRQGRIRRFRLFRALTTLVYFTILTNRLKRVHSVQFATRWVCGLEASEVINERKRSPWTPTPERTNPKRAPIVTISAFESNFAI